ncbi:MAG: hypothetical protein CMK09_02300 [Ponticaulis sp.]|nr:hypothetical protein [Ponticaulis sp.]|tara:strand:- start:44890 stop:46401 length:1512 start_codon:yes stop_codon:yes gene_type:complete
MTDEPQSTGRPAMARVTGDAESHIRPPEERGGAFDKPAIGWVMFEFARNPYYILVIIYVFAPYLAQIAGDEALRNGLFDGMTDAAAQSAANAHGQAFMAGITKWSGFFAAATAPILGATLDRGGKRKPLVGFVLFLVGLMSFLLWWAKPEGEGFSLFTIGAIMVVAYISFTYSEVIHNSMLSDAGRPAVLSRISGLGLAMGNFGAILLLLFVILAFELPGMAGIPFKEPLFGLDTSQSEGLRSVGPLAAIWLAIFIWPFFLWCPDAGRKGANWFKAAREGLAGLVQTIKRAKDHKEVMKFLFARMIYADGTSALMMMGAVYVAGVLAWNPVELAGYAIWLTLFAVVGGFFASVLDRILGMKMAIVLELSVMTVVLVLLISINQESIFFGLIESERLLPGEIYSHTHDWFYLVIAALLGTFVTALLSSSRSMLVALAPKHMIGEFFGLYAIAGTVTVWIGPLLIETFTRAFNSQSIGISTIGILFVLGLLALGFVRYKKGDVAD